MKNLNIEVGQIQDNLKNDQKQQGDLKKATDDIINILKAGDEERKAFEKRQKDSLEKMELEAGESHADIKELKDSMQKQEIEIARHRFTDEYLAEKAVTSDSKIAESHQPESFLYFEQEEWKQKKEEFIQKARNALKGNSTYSPGIIDFGGRPLSITNDSSEDYWINGIFEQGVASFDFANNKPNTIYFEEPAFSGIQSDMIQILADPSKDRLMLDGCLKWTMILKDKKAQKWKADDIEGKERFIEVSASVPVNVQKTCDNRYIFREEGKIVEKLWENPSETAQETNLIGAASSYGEAKTQARVSLDLQAMDRENILSYKNWLQLMPTQKAKSDIGMIVDMMSKGGFPTAVPLWLLGSNPHQYILTPLNLNSDQMQVTEANHDPCSHDMTIVSGEGPGSTLTCVMGIHYYFLSDGQDNIKSSAVLGVFDTEAGDDEVHSGRGVDIIILKKGWGREKIDKSCDVAKLEYAPIMKDYGFINETFGGIGMSYAKSKESTDIVVINVIPGKPAYKGGIKAGDRILKIDGQSVSDVTFEVMKNKMRGEQGTQVVITVKTGGDDGIVKDVPMTRENIDMGSREDVRLLDYKWPLPFNNFIIFGPEIKKSDMYWRKDNLINRSTGDEIDFTTGSRCYNFIYSDEVLNAKTRKKPAGVLQ